MIISKIIAMITAAATALSANAAPTKSSVETLTVTGAQTLAESGDYKYEVLDNGTAKITDINDWDKDVVDVPAEIDGYAVTEIGRYAFYGLSDTTEIIIPEGVTVIGDDAFGDCHSLAKITLPSSLISIGKSAFYACGKLSSINIPNGVESIGDYAFLCCGLTEINIPDSVVSIGEGPFSICTLLTKITVSSGNKNYCAVDGVLFDIDQTTLIKYPGEKSGTAYAIPDSVTTIGSGAFEYCKKLTKITIPDGVTEIGDSAFSGCEALEAIKLPEGLTRIGEFTFNYCKSLTEITIPDGVEVIDFCAFYHCSSLAEITIPGSVTEIVEGALDECDAITDVYFAFEEADTLPFTVSYGNNAIYEAKRHFLITLTDPETGVKTEFYDNYFDTEETPAFAAPTVADTATIADAAAKKIDAEQIAAAYNIAFSDADGAVQPIKSVKMYLPVPDEYANAPETALYVYRLGDKGMLSDMKATSKNGYLVFDADKPGTFFVSTEKIATFLPGDADGNGKVNAGDARLVLKVTAKVATISDECFDAADMNGNGKIDSGDARAILKLTIK